MSQTDTVTAPLDPAEDWQLIVYESACAAPTAPPQSEPTIGVFTAYSLRRQVKVRVSPGDWIFPSDSPHALQLQRLYMSTASLPVAFMADHEFFDLGVMPDRSLYFQGGRWHLQEAYWTRRCIDELTSQVALLRRAADPSCAGTSIVAALGL